MLLCISNVMQVDKLESWNTGNGFFGMCCPFGLSFTHVLLIKACECVENNMYLYNNKIHTYGMLHKVAYILIVYLFKFYLQVMSLIKNLSINNLIIQVKYKVK